jgi:flagella basal body P-ring formation protein FlgA
VKQWLLIGCFFCELALATDVSLELRTQSDIALPRYYLSDLVNCKSTSPLCREISGIEIGKTPSPGQIIQVSRLSLQDILAKEWPNVAILWSGADLVQLKGTYQEISSDSIRTALEQSLEEFSNDDTRVIIQKLTISGRALARASQTSIEFPELARSSSSHSTLLRRFAGARVLDVQFINPTDSADRTSTSVQIQSLVERYLPVATSAIAAGSIISAQDLSLAWIPMKQQFTYSAPAERIELLVGKKARFVLNEGEAISLKYVELPKIVERGQVLNLVVRAAALQVTTRASAGSAAVIGQVIDVLNLATKKHMKAKIVDSQTAEAVVL